MFKKITTLFLCFALLFNLTACGKNTETDQENSSDQLKISASFYAMAEFAEAIGKEKVSVSTIIPDGTEPHDFEPKAADLTALSKADLFIYNGLGMESWAENAISASNNSKMIAVQAATNVTPISNSEPGEVKEHGQYDPHIWLSLKNAQTIAANIKDAFIQADSKNESFYENNYQEFSSQLTDLYEQYQQKFQQVYNKNFVTGHAAFAYLCRDFDLTQNSVEDVFAEGEPSARQMVDLISYCKANGVKTIFSEKLASPEVSQTLAKEVGANVKEIYTIESSEDDKTYLDAMKQNLDEIYTSLME